MTAFFKITPSNFLHWALFRGRDDVRRLLDRFSGRPGREESALQYVRERASRNDPESILAAMDEFASNERFLMNIGVAKGAILEQAVKDSGAGRVLVLGGYCGYSAIRTARHLAPNDGKLISIEKSAKFADIAGQIVDYAGLSDRIEIKVGDAGDVIPHLEGSFDLVFIHHWKDRYLPDLLLIERHGLLHEGSIVVADHVGIFAGALTKYLHHVRTDPHYDTTHVPAHLEYHDRIQDGLEVSVYRHRAA